MMRMLDLFCKAGGAAKGYYDAGFTDICGVDIEWQPNYKYHFVQCDVFDFLENADLSRFDFIHASPPCQNYSKCASLAKARNNGVYGEHPDYIERLRSCLEKTGKPYVIENVVGAPLLNPLSLSGSQFPNLYTQRTRLFESNVPLIAPDNPRIKHKTPAAGNGIGEDGFISICGSGGVRGLNETQIRLYYGFALGGIDWMTRAELVEAIPPAYTEFIGKQVIDFLTVQGG